MRNARVVPNYLRVKVKRRLKVKKSVDVRKMRNLAIAANTYVKEQKVDRELRFDVVTVVGVGHQVKRIEHLVDAFNPLLIG